MFRRIGNVVVRHPVWTIVAWLAAAVAIVATAPSLPSNSDESSFLPKRYESIKAADLQQKAFLSDFTPSAIALYQRTDGGRLTAGDKQDVARITAELGKKHIDQAQKVVPGPPSRDGRYALTLVQMDSKNAGQPEQADAAKELREDVKQLAKGTHPDARLGGSAAQALDQQDSSQRGQALIGVGRTHRRLSVQHRRQAAGQGRLHRVREEAVDGVASARMTQVSRTGTTADFTVTLEYEASTDKAIETVDRVRDVAHADAPDRTEALVGGMSSIFKDIDTAVNHDYRTVFPAAALLIMVILGLLLRSVVAPWYLIASVGLGFDATLGATVWIFQEGQGHSGLMFMLPVIMYLFVVAIGTDYNILVIARLREEAREGREPREAAGMALRHAGPTVAAAGFSLAATFATMTLAGNALLTEMGFAVSFGIAVAAFVMAMFFTPSLTALIGHAVWWPGHGDRVEKATEKAAAGAGAGFHGSGPLPGEDRDTVASNPSR